MPEGLFHNEIDIAKLTLEQPERLKPDFDVSEIIDEEAWSTLKQELESEWKENIYKAVSIAFDLYMLYPERLPELGLNEAIWQKVKTAYENELRDVSSLRGQPGENETIDTNLTRIAETMILFSKAASDFPTLQPYIVRGLELVRADAAQLGQGKDLVAICWALSIIAGTNPLDDSVPNIEKLVEGATDRRRYTVYGSLQTEAKVRMLFETDYKRKYPMPLKWTDYVGELSRLSKLVKERNVSPKEVAGCAVWMKILAAKKVLVAADEVKIVMNNALGTGEETVSLPESRKF
jgi:hypothetical protein